MKKLYEAYSDLAEERISYLRQYTHDSPMIMSLETYYRTEQLGKVLRKVICYFAQHYTQWLAYMPFRIRDLEILAICSKYPFRVGTYRTDFIITPAKELKIIEMTTRFPLNGYIDSGFFYQIGLSMAEELNLPEVRNPYSPFLDFLCEDFSPNRRISVIKGYDRMVEFKIYSQIFKQCFDFQVVELGDLKSQRQMLKEATLIEELNLDEIRTLPNDLIEELCACGIFNDFRNLFLVHDKRFFQMLTLNEFLDQCLTKEEQDLLAEFMIPTYTYSQNPEFFRKAYCEKDSWIIKPYNLGKSVGVIAGCTVTEQYWKTTFDTGAAEQCVLQPMISQRKYKGTIGDEQRDDYVAGTLLYMDGRYYGPGLYRASSFVVTNQRDDRKMAPVVADVNKENPILNVI
jgi:hypothetical protein